MALTVSSLLSGTVDQHAQHEHSDCPVSYCPIEKWPKIREQPCCVFPDNVHVTTSGKLFAYELEATLNNSQGCRRQARPFRLTLYFYRIIK